MPRKKHKAPKRRPVFRSPKYRNKILNTELDAAYDRFCGVGLHTVKQELASLAESDWRAMAYLSALEIEILSRRAKRRQGDLQQRLYKEKRAKIRSFLAFCQEREVMVEIEAAADSGQAHVVYVYLPGCEQISWHTSLDSSFAPTVCAKGWDGQKYSALRKLEQGIRRSFPSLGRR